MTLRVIGSMRIVRDSVRQVLSEEQQEITRARREYSGLRVKGDDTRLLAETDFVPIDIWEDGECDCNGPCARDGSIDPFGIPVACVLIPLESISDIDFSMLAIVNWSDESLSLFGLSDTFRLSVMDPMDIVEEWQAQGDTAEKNFSNDILETINVLETFGEAHLPKRRLGDLMRSLHSLEHLKFLRGTLHATPFIGPRCRAITAVRMKSKSSFQVTVITRVVNGKKKRKVVYSATPSRCQ